MRLVVLTFTNSSASPHTYWIEPWAHDFTILPGETFEVRLVCSETPMVEYVNSGASTQVYLNGVSDWQALQGEAILELGHNRHHSEDS